ncbi:MAG: 4-alpha-glucanotransferase [Candidatus Omnitrophota bacterium]|jgi:4-alpha-glucanotransferase
MKTKLHNAPYAAFTKTKSRTAWKAIGLKRRSGVALPLFSVHSKNSMGIGEITDLELLADWCLKCGMSIIQLLPLQDTGSGFRPYDAESSFALDPMYLNLSKIPGIKLANYKNEFSRLKKRYSSSSKKVNYGIKAAKLKLLWRMFNERNESCERDFKKYILREKFWIKDYALFKTIQYVTGQSSWEKWEKGIRHRNKQWLNLFSKEHKQSILYYQWMQWQLCMQMEGIKKSLSKKGILLMGDIPFLVSRSSADVWTYQSYFKLDYEAGAPPDYFLAAGQRWGMPPYNWKVIAQHKYDYLSQKLKYAERFYHMYRIDHAIGIFRLWTIPASDPMEAAGRNGFFEPSHEKEWIKQGEELLNVMLKSSSMLPCAEDLGTIPDCSPGILKKFGIPGMDIQRWMRDWVNESRILDNEEYRACGISSISTHDTAPFLTWWQELSDGEKRSFGNFFDRDRNIRSQSLNKCTVLAIQKILAAPSVFSIQLIHDWLALTYPKKKKAIATPINHPGTFMDSNWSWRIPYSLEELKKLPINKDIKSMHQKSGRN